MMETLTIDNDGLAGVVIPVLTFLKLKTPFYDMIVVEGGDLGKPDSQFIIYYESLKVVELEDGTRWDLYDKTKIPDSSEHRWFLRKK